jgi:hypothetical protein
MTLTAYITSIWCVLLRAALPGIGELSQGEVLHPTAGCDTAIAGIFKPAAFQQA